LALHDFGNEMCNLGLIAGAFAGLLAAAACAPRTARPHPAAIVTPTADEDAALKAWETRMVRPCKRVGQRMVC
jgi:hypothetical protein